MSRWLLVALVATIGCLNVDPVAFEPPESGVRFDTALDDVADADANADTALSCYGCIQAPDDPGPGCGDEFATCAANDKCKAIMDCVFAAGCFFLATTKDFVACAIPCAADAGVSTTGDPVVTLGLNVAYCADKKCRPFCGGGDAGS